MTGVVRDILLHGKPQHAADYEVSLEIFCLEITLLINVVDNDLEKFPYKKKEYKNFSNVGQL